MTGDLTCSYGGHIKHCASLLIPMQPTAHVNIVGYCRPKLLANIVEYCWIGLGLVLIDGFQHTPHFIGHYISSIYF